MHLDIGIAAAGLLVGMVVGLTGMGGGALMTPLLVLGFGVQPLAAVSSDLVSAFVMKPVGGAVHLRHGTVNRHLVLWLVIGSVPAAFLGVLLLRASGSGAALQDVVQVALGAALVVAAASLVVRSALISRRRQTADVHEIGAVTVRRLPTLAIGAIGGLIVGLTSVGSGSLMIVLLLALYPRLTSDRLVGTDLVQAVPLVGAAALGHLLFGDVRLGLTASLILGSVPGVYIGARISARHASGALVRRLLTLVLALSGIKLLGVGAPILAACACVGLTWLVARPVYTHIRRLHRSSAGVVRVRSTRQRPVDEPS